MVNYIIALCGVLALAASQSDNPFVGQTYYINPSFQAEIASSIATCPDPVTCTNLRVMQKTASAYWIDTMAKISGNDTKTVQGILADASKKSPAQLVVFIVYDVPNRDCHAKASNGEICCNPNPDGTCNYDAGGDCSAGILEYQTKYINPLAALFQQYQDKVPIVAIIEPDSLPNLATNKGDPHCGNSATTAAYMQGIPYAINTIRSKAPKVNMYVDAAHGGWLGWPNNAAQYSQLIQQMNIANAIRGFATNVANYQPLGTMCPQFDYCLNGQHQSDPCCADPCRLESQWNPGNNEHNYILELEHVFSWMSPSPHFIIDSGRNGVGGMRSDCANWCNIRGAGVGRLPTTDTDDQTGRIDAYYWLKTPGESDGCTQTLPSGSTCARYDSFCGSVDSIGSRSGEPHAPLAGNWFDYQVKMLAANAAFNGTAS